MVIHMIGRSMGIKTVRLDRRSEALLRDLVRRTGMNASQTLKAGLQALHRSLQEDRGKRPWDVYRTLDLGPGGYARAPASQAKQAVREIIRRKHGR